MKTTRSLLVGLVLSGLSSLPYPSFAKTLTCDLLLGFQGARRAQAAAAEILAEDADESAAYGYVGVSEAELLELVNTGRLKTAVKHRVTTDHPAFARLARVRAVPWPAAARLAMRDAWVKAAVEALRAQKSGAPIDAAKLAAVLERLEVTTDKDRALASFDRIARAVTEANLPELGEGPHARLRRLAQILGIEWPTPFRRGSATERSLVARLSHLPAGAGARLALSDRVANRLQFAKGSYVLPYVDLKDVVAIHSNCAAVGTFLNDLEARARPN